jgi:hypothetical protein
MEASPFDHDDWLLHELTYFNGKINKTTFPKESRETGFSFLDAILELVVSIPPEDLWPTDATANSSNKDRCWRVLARCLK